jgi:hypothetical protein
MMTALPILCAFQQDFYATRPEVAGASIPPIAAARMPRAPRRVSLLEKIRIVGFTQSHRRLSFSDIGGALVGESSGGHISHTE